MTFSSIFYTLLFSPLETFFEILFSLSNGIFQNPGVSIVILSLAMNLLALPLYKKADELQMEERKREAKLRPWIVHIKKHFKGAERFLILRTYYRQNHYKPTDALNDSVSLLLQIPFFIAAYHFLSHLQLLNGVSFGPLLNLGAPDNLLTVGDVPISLLPILMTMVNIFSCRIYLEGMPLKNKIQAYGTAVVFLLLLHDSPSGLVFYWTLNNLFSLGKNIWYKLKPNRLVLPWSISLLGVVTGGWILAAGTPTPKIKALAIVLAVAAQIPLLAQRFKKQWTANLRLPERNDRIFNLGCLFMILLTGLFIPINLIRSSPVEFIDPVLVNHPLEFVLFTTLLAIGAFGIWFQIFYKLTTDKFKGVAAHALWLFASVSFCDYMLVGGDYGLISANLTFEGPLFSLRAQVVNLLVVFAVLLVALAVSKYRKNMIAPAYLILSVAMLAPSAW